MMCVTLLLTEPSTQECFEDGCLYGNYWQTVVVIGFWINVQYLGFEGLLIFQLGYGIMSVTSVKYHPYNSRRNAVFWVVVCKAVLMCAGRRCLVFKRKFKYLNRWKNVMFE